MLKKKKGNNPGGSGGSSSGNHASSSTKIRSPAVIQPVAELDSSGFDDSSTNTGCSNKTQIYSTTV